MKIMSFSGINWWIWINWISSCKMDYIWHYTIMSF